MRCKTCHYSLTGLTEHRCPECGTPFDPNDPSTFNYRPASRWPRRILISATISALPAMPMFFGQAFDAKGARSIHLTPIEGFLVISFFSLVLWAIGFVAALVIVLTVEFCWRKLRKV